MVSLFEGDKTSWNVKNESDIKLFCRLEKYEVIAAILNEEKLCDITPEERIGSESTMGEVYKWREIAVKIMPIINNKSLQNNIYESNLALEASNLVIEGKSRYFPLVYNWVLCESTLFYNHQNSKFSNKSIDYQKTKELQSNLLFSELAYSDLKNYALKLEYIILEEEIDEVILQVFKGVRDLQLHHNIIHNDLHLGNILLLYNPKVYGIHVLIHDFGRSLKVKVLGNNQRKKDIITFIIAIRELRREPHLKKVIDFISESLDNVLEIIEESTSNFPILDVIRYWKNKG